MKYDYNVLFEARTRNGEPVFSTDHKYECGRVLGVQSNVFRCKIPKDFEEFTKLVKEVSNKIFDFKNENGEEMAFPADVLIIPENADVIFDLASRFVDENARWTVVRLKDWKPMCEEFLVLSNFGAGCFWLEEGVFTWKFVAKVIGEKP